MKDELNFKCGNDIVNLYECGETNILSNDNTNEYLFLNEKVNVCVKNNVRKITFSFKVIKDIPHGTDLYFRIDNLLDNELASFSKLTSISSNAVKPNIDTSRIAPYEETQLHIVFKNESGRSITAGDKEYSIDIYQLLGF